MPQDLPALFGVHLELDRRINFALQQNDVPVIKQLRLENRGDAPIRDVEVSLRSDPDFAADWTARVAVIGPGEQYVVPSVELQLSHRFLGGLTERVRGQIHVECRAGSDVLASGTEPVELLARDEWAGTVSLPEILAAFALPNHPSIAAVLGVAAKTLGEWTGDPSLSGYQAKDPKRVFTTAAAVYAALHSLQLTYINPPASFESTGQRVRLPDQILAERMATCLDLALLAAGALEQAGLHPLVILVSGHAFAGVWLNEECFSEPAISDVLRVRKRVDLKEIAVFDPTAVTVRPAVGFEHAQALAHARLVEPDTFQYAIDVRRSRKGRIRPLPEWVERPSTTGEESADGVPTGVPTLPPGLESVVDGAPRPPLQETPAGRLDRWQRRLLDLSLRNKLLSFKESKKTLRLMVPDVERLEDMLAEGVSFQIHPRPKELDRDDPRDAEAHQRRTGRRAIDEVLKEQLAAKRLHSDSTKEDLDRRLLEIYRAARLGLEEGGASALYLAVGFLSWYETDTSAQQHRAPILLFPLELHRASTRQGFTVKLGDDEPRVNVTLLELLRQDYGLTIPNLDPLPEDESGLDVGAILRTVRRAVRDIDRWEVEDDVRIGIFSFAKFLMWRDLKERSADLMRNAVVAHMVQTPGAAFDPDGTFPDADRLDDDRSPTDTFCPLPADSSQLAAVVAAAEGRSFVLEGPPGTGKSQTIANLIAHCLTMGKSVLFVSEKMAALNVVRSRLVAVGLGRFCLELHSNKAHKREVVAQLGESLARITVHDAADWTREAGRLATLRQELNAYVNALHRRWPSGDTLFLATSRLVGLRDVPTVPLAWPAPDAVDAEHLAELRDLVGRLTVAAEACGSVNAHPWAGVREGDWTPGWQDQLHEAIALVSDATQRLASCTSQIAAALSPEDVSPSLEGLARLATLTEALTRGTGSPPGLVAGDDWDAIQSDLAAWIEHGRTRDALREELRQGFRDDLLRLDLDALLRQLSVARASHWPLSWLRMRVVRIALTGVATGQLPPAATFTQTLTTAMRCRDVQGQLDLAGDRARELLGRHWNGGEADWDGVATAREWAGELRGLARQMSRGGKERETASRRAWAVLMSDRREDLTVGGALHRLFAEFREALEGFRRARMALIGVASLESVTVGGLESPDLLPRTAELVTRWQGAWAQLRDWCHWYRTRSDAMSQGLGPLVTACESGLCPPSMLASVFERSYAEWWVNAVTNVTLVVSRFSSPEHQRKIHRFREVDDKYRELTKSLIQSKLGERVPHSGAGILPNSETGILQRELSRKRGHLPVRQLLQRIPNLLPRLKPCLLMSPISVAQYLDAGFPAFDVVVFDEASQIPVWDAVGALARGRQAVIVGDPKQLPPTNFFQRSEEDDEEALEDSPVDDLESILDECIGAQIPWLPLNWHYRSKHESLISFSNREYYGNRLLTFPSPALEGLGVTWRHVSSGVYDKGKSRTNRAEADEIVAEILRRLRSPQQAKHSIGVVTFSQAQQVLIEDLLEAARSADPALDEHFNEERPERVFVKNLENVQGDERDVIFFSICYGPDGNGKVSMNFGPMNRDGGERRLNVAITRARREVLVYSTLRAEHIDLSRSRARGVADLKKFLEFAERGPSVLGRSTEFDPNADFDSPFEEAVHDALIRHGWQVHKQVGSAHYRIDLAVVDPNAPGRYLLGVECDGANYHRARNARDRDKLREAILRDLGWQLHRIWSTDWWREPGKEVDKLLAALEQARTAGQDKVVKSLAKAVLTPFVEMPTQVAPPPPSGLQTYRPWSPRRAVGSAGEFHGPGAEARIRQVITEVVSHEGPLSLRLAAKRVAGAWGFERVSPSVVERTRLLVPRETVHVQTTADGQFLWPTSQEPGQYQDCRVPDASGDVRDTDDLPLEEVANAALYLLKSNLTAPLDELVREMARLLGYQRLGSSVEARMRKGVTKLLRSGRARREGDMIMPALDDREIV